MKKRKLKRSVKVFFYSVIILFVLMFNSLIFYSYMLSSVSNEENSEFKKFVIEQGTSTNAIISNLKKENLIRDEFFVKLHIKLNDINQIQAGEYELSTSYDSKKIIDILEKGKVSNSEEINFTFQEGRNIRHLAVSIESQTHNTKEEVFDLLKDSSYINSLIEKHWFLTDEIKNQELFFPLEGYLFPDTYRIYVNSSVKDIFDRMLKRTDDILTQKKDEIEKSNYTVHEFLTFTSIVESEGINNDDWGKIAGVFYNRLERNMAFESCVTACYATNTDPCYSSRVQLNFISPYNTYLQSSAGKLPIGPVSNPGLAAINATLNPEDHNFVFFLSDKNQKTYFSATYTEHNNKIAELKRLGLWL